VLRTAGETETMLVLDEGDAGFQLLTEEKTAADIIRILLWEKNQIVKYKKLIHLFFKVFAS
jgi:hypothetical protein